MGHYCGCGHPFLPAHVSHIVLCQMEDKERNGIDFRFYLCWHESKRSILRVIMPGRGGIVSYAGHHSFKFPSECLRKTYKCFRQTQLYLRQIWNDWFWVLYVNSLKVRSLSEQVNEHFLNLHTSKNGWPIQDLYRNQNGLSFLPSKNFQN